MAGNSIGAAGHFLAESINQWGEEQQLEKIYINGCRIPETQCCEIIQSLSKCKYFTHLNMSCNRIGNSGEHLARTIQQWGKYPPLQSLYLSNCSIPEKHCSTILQSLPTCIHLTGLSMTGNSIGAAANFLAESIKSWGFNPPLRHLSLRKCSLEEKTSGEFLKSEDAKTL